MAKRKRMKKEIFEKISTKVNLDDFFDEFDDKFAPEKYFPKADKKPLNDILNQRFNQRDKLFNYALFWTSTLMIFLISGIFVQSYIRIKYIPDFTIVDPVTLNIFAISVLSQFVGVIGIIAKYLWDDKVYKELLEKDNHQE